MEFADLMTTKSLVVLLLATILLSLVILEAIDSGVIDEDDGSDIFPRQAPGGFRSHDRAVRRM